MPPVSPPLRLSHQLQRRLLTGSLLSSVSLALIVACFGFAHLQADLSGSPLAALTARHYEFDFFLVIDCWIWSLGSLWVLHRLLAPVLRELDQLERASLSILQADTVPASLPLASLADNQSNLILQAYRVLLTRLANSAVPQMNFLEIVSHELRSPLASILGYAALMSKQWAQLPATAVDHYAGIIGQQAQRMDQLVESILTAAKADGGRLTIHCTPVRLRGLIAEVIEEARQQTRREIGLEDALVNSEVWGDPLRLREVFANLVENALKYSSTQTAVKVCLRSIEAGDDVEIAIQDQGIGIAETELPLLFTRFGRIRKPETQAVPGNGLGLYIVKHIVEGHGGAITVRSQPGEGATFVVRLPLNSHLRWA